ncbi:helix-turn-helix domain-containing protein [Nocardioides sp. T2.26MG-1]|uniref:helix-turn-helix domain-containing protein n=1 Tax=Nocardioides sp. T2.26MG-1 TaxID=3041166 RepID=UPI00406D2321
MLTREEDIDAHALRRQGMSISAIARHLGRDRKTIRAYLAGERVAGVRKPAGEDRSSRTWTTSASASPKTRTCGR